MILHGPKERQWDALNIDHRTSTVDGSSFVRFRSQSNRNLRINATPRDVGTNSQTIPKNCFELNYQGFELPIHRRDSKELGCIDLSKLFDAKRTAILRSHLASANRGFVILSSIRPTLSTL